MLKQILASVKYFAAGASSAAFTARDMLGNGEYLRIQGYSRASTFLRRRIVRPGGAETIRRRGVNVLHRYAHAVILLGAVWIGGCKGPQCENKAFFGLPSPDGASIAFVFHRKCAAKVAVTTDVTVLDFHSPLRNEPGNVLAVGNEQPVRVSWLGPHKLVVTGFVEPIYRRNSQVGSITIEFRPADARSNSARPREP
jgi:hypothetical protein